MPKPSGGEPLPIPPSTTYRFFFSPPTTLTLRPFRHPFPFFTTQGTLTCWPCRTNGIVTDVGHITYVSFR